MGPAGYRPTQQNAKPNYKYAIVPDRPFMNKLLLICFVVFIQGCLISERTWNVGTCRQSSAGSYGCSVIVPKRVAGVDLRAQIDPKPLQVPSTDLRIKLHNHEPHVIEVSLLEGKIIHIPSGGDFEISAKSEWGGWIICFLDTSNGAIKLGVEVVDGKPKDGAIRIVAHSSDAL
jgi:hypothetical protein